MFSIFLIIFFAKQLQILFFVTFRLQILFFVTFRLQIDLTRDKRAISPWKRWTCSDLRSRVELLEACRGTAVDVGQSGWSIFSGPSFDRYRHGFCAFTYSDSYRIGFFTLFEKNCFFHFLKLPTNFLLTCGGYLLNCCCLLKRQQPLPREQLLMPSFPKAVLTYRVWQPKARTADGLVKNFARVNFGLVSCRKGDTKTIWLR